MHNVDYQRRRHFIWLPSSDNNLFGWDIFIIIEQKTAEISRDTVLADAERKPSIEVPVPLSLKGGTAVSCPNFQTNLQFGHDNIFLYTIQPS